MNLGVELKVTLYFPALLGYHISYVSDTQTGSEI